MVDQTTAPTAKEIAERKNERLRMWTALLGLLTAVLALLSGVLVKRNDAAATKVDTTQEQVKVLASKNAELEADNAGKDARIKQLEADLAARPNGSEPSTKESPTGVATETPAVFHKGPLVLKYRSDANLDAPPEDTQWNLGSDEWDIKFYTDEPAEFITNVRSRALLLRAEPSFETCKTNTGYSDQRISVRAMQASKTLCVLTGEGRYSVMAIKKATNTEVAFEVTTYSKDGD